MTLKDARALQAEIRAKGYHCTVPLGHGPDGYAPHICGSCGPIRFDSRAAFRLHHARRLRDHRDKLRMYRALVERRQLVRSPIEMMVDRACGLEIPAKCSKRAR